MNIVVTLCLTFSIIALSLTSPAHAEVYKWKDEDGNIIYGDTPPSSQAKKIKIRKGPANTEDHQRRMEKRQRLLDVMQEERDEKNALKQKEQEEKARREAECQRLIAELQQMRNASFLYEETGDPFNPKVLSDEQRKQEQNKYQDYIDENC